MFQMVPCISSWFLLIAEDPSYGYTTFRLSVHLSSIREVSSVQVINAAITIHLQVLVWTNAFIFLEKRPRSQMAESRDQSMFTFLRN